MIPDKPLLCPRYPATCAMPSTACTAVQVRTDRKITQRKRARGSGPGPILGHCNDADLREANPDTLHYRIWHIPARLAHHARQRVLKISPDWPWKEAFLACWQRLCSLPAPA